ncbi:MAG: MarR family transcriptional regulator [Thermoguttaceae bacterium]|nr:MarR family transcriptional regulator [Thermoguttaceae bacterium]MDW8037202.1 MarR family transcriptional regulator [Thermoguttaceae bacterium]
MADSLVTPAGMKILKILVGNAPQTVSELIRKTGVTRTAITEQLNELMAAGFVQRTVQPVSGRGRPRYLYSVTHTALIALFPGSAHLVVPAIWRAIRKIGGQKLIHQIIQEVTEELVSYYSERITARQPEKRLRQLLELWRQEGCVLDVSERNGHITIQKRSCPFLSMYEASGDICYVDLELMSAIVGHPVRRVTSRHEGAPCCSFELDFETRKRSSR